MASFSSSVVSPALVVMIDSKENAMDDSNAMLLRVPNHLLHSLYQKKTAATHYISLIKFRYLDKVIQLRPDSKDLARKFHH